MKIQIENPTPGGAAWTGRNRALRLIKAGRAAAARKDTTGAILSIRILAHALNQAEMRALERQQAERLAKLQAERVYDSVDRDMTIDECAGLPMCGDLEKTQQKPTSALAGWAYRAAVRRYIRKSDDPGIVVALRERAQRRAELLSAVF
jgi:hypothetical protein